MLRRCFQLLILVFGLIGPDSFLFAQSFKFNSRPKGVNLPVQNILDIEQDTLGRMWFSTTRGVVYSDGIQTHELPDTLVRKFSYRISVLKDEDGVIWLYNANGVPVLFKALMNGWEEVLFPEEAKSEYSSGIGLFSVGKSPNKVFFLDTGDKLYHWKEGEVKKGLLARDFSQTGALLSVLQTEDYILLNFKHETYQLDGGQLSPYAYRGISLPSPPVLIKKSPDSGEYYFLGRSYLAKGPQSEFPTELISQGFSTTDYVEDDFFSLAFSGQNVFYHFNSHLLKYNSARSRPLLIDLSGFFNTIYLQTMFIDREGILWVGSSRGLANNNSQVFQNYGLEVTEFLGEELTAIADLGDGSFLFGYNNGIQKFSRFQIETIYRDPNARGLPNQRIINFSKDARGDIWFSANSAGVGFFNPKNDKITLHRAPGDINVSSVQVAGDSLLITSPKQIFIAPLDSKGSQFYTKNLTPEIEDHLKGVPSFFRKAGKLKNGKIVVLRASRLENQYPIVETSRYLLAEGYDFLEMPDGSVLLGTEYGLKVYREGYQGYYLYGGKSITNAVFALLQDQSGMIWAGTDNGVFLLGDGKVRQFNETNGLIGDEVNRGALIQAVSGRVMIGTQKGLSIYFSEEDFYAEGTPKVFLNSVRLGEGEVVGKENLKLSYSQNSLEVDFLATGFNESKNLWIHYRIMETADTEWVVIKNPGSNQLFFSNLPAGRYRFEMKASYDGENFSETVSSPGFEILAPFYLRPWFLGLAVLFLVGLGVLINMVFRQLQNLGILQSAVAKESKGKVVAEQQFKNVWKSSQDGMMLTLEGEKILTVNPAFASMMGTTVNSLENQSLSVLFKEENHQEFYLDVLLQRVRKSPGQGVSIETPIEWKTGLLDMEVFSVLVDQDMDGKGLVLSVFKDISAQKAVENTLKEAKDKAEQANRFKTSLLSNISHEIRTPLNGIIAGAEHIMMNRSQDAELLSQLDIILQSGERLLGTITSLLDLAKIEANKLPVVYTETEVRDFMETIIQPLTAAARRKGLELSFQFLSPRFLGKIDRRFMEMVVNNLVSNSIKYSNGGEVRISVLRENSMLLLEVSDSGVGMSADFQHKMFVPFEQESKGNDRLYEGTGLGLSITRNLIQLLGGKIQVWSAKNSGTRVLVEIPLPDA